MASLTPQKLSSLSTSTLTAVLELTRSSQQSLQPSPTLIPRITKNLNNLHAGILELQSQAQSHNPDGPSPEVVQGLRSQYTRLCNLVDGLGVECRSLDEAQLIEYDERSSPKPAEAPWSPDPDGSRAISPSTSPPPSQSQSGRPSTSSFQPQTSGTEPLIPHMSIPMGDLSEEREAREDEESMRDASSQLQMQRQQMDEQDSTLDLLSQAISRQRDLSHNISSELEEHNRMLEETDEAVDSTQAKLKRAGRKLERVGRRTAKESSATCIIVALIVILLLLIILLK